jgi:hypothetical protein
MGASDSSTGIMALYRACPTDAAVVCFDEFGPISLQPYPGHCNAQRKRRWWRRATYVRGGGVRYFFGAYDVHRDVLFGGYRLAKTTSEAEELVRRSPRESVDGTSSNCQNWLPCTERELVASTIHRLRDGYALQNQLIYFTRRSERVVFRD